MAGLSTTAGFDRMLAESPERGRLGFDTAGLFLETDRTPPARGNGLPADRAEGSLEFATLFAIDGVRRRLVDGVSAVETGRSAYAKHGAPAFPATVAIASAAGLLLGTDNEYGPDACKLGPPLWIFLGGFGIAKAPDRGCLMPDTSNLLLVPLPTGAGLAGLGLGLVALRRRR